LLPRTLAELLPVPGKDEDFDRVAQNVEDIEDSLEEALAVARSSLKCPQVVFKDIFSSSAPS